MSQVSQAGTCTRTCSSSCPEPSWALRCGAPGDPQGTQMGWGTPGTPGTDSTVPPTARMKRHVYLSWQVSSLRGPRLTPSLQSRTKGVLWRRNKPKSAALFSQGGSWRTANITAVAAGDTHKAAPRSQHPHLCCKVQFPAFHHQNTGSTHHGLSRQQREVRAASCFTSRHICQICSSHSRSRPLPSSLTFPIQPFCVKLNSYLFAF